MRESPPFPLGCAKMRCAVALLQARQLAGRFACDARVQRLRPIEIMRKPSGSGEGRASRPHTHRPVPLDPEEDPTAPSRCDQVCMEALKIRARELVSATG